MTNVIEGLDIMVFMGVAVAVAIEMAIANVSF